MNQSIEINKSQKIYYNIFLSYIKDHTVILEAKINTINAYFLRIDYFFY